MSMLAEKMILELGIQTLTTQLEATKDQGDTITWLDTYLRLSTLKSELDQVLITMGLDRRYKARDRQRDISAATNDKAMTNEPRTTKTMWHSLLGV